MDAATIENCSNNCSVTGGSGDFIGGIAGSNIDNARIIDCYNVGTITGTFYDAAGRNMRFAKMGVMAVEMEAAGLYCTAAYTGKRALAICSISDNLVTGEELSTDERQTNFTNMMKIALEVAVKMATK